MMAETDATPKPEGTVAAIVLAVLSLVLIQPSIRGIDGAGNYVYLMSILRDGDLDFRNDYAAIDLSRQTPYRMSETPAHPTTGRAANRFGIGAAIFWAPAVAIVHAALLLADPEMATGLSRPYEWAVGIASAWWGCLGVWLLFMRLREQFASVPAWTAAAGIVMATPLAFYVWAHGSMSHAVSFFISVMMLLWLERSWNGRSGGAALLTGLWAGLLVVTRFQDASWAVAIFAAMVIFWPGEARGTEAVRFRVGRWVAGGLFGLGGILAMIPQLAVWKELYGSYLSGPLPYFNQGAGKFDFLPRHFIEVLVSERGGVIAWHPILAIAAVGLFLRWEAISKPLRWAAIGGLALQLYLVSCWSVWWAGASFGNRFFISSYPFLALGLAGLLKKSRAPVWVGPAAVVVLVAWNAGLLIQYGTEMIPRETEVGWGLVLHNQFVEVPGWILMKVGH